MESSTLAASPKLGERAYGSTASVQQLRLLLRVAVGLCFIGHGAFGVMTKEAWLPYFALVGIEAGLAYGLMPVVGTVDILIGLAVLVRPIRWLLAYAALWCVWTAALRPLAGEGVWEMIERAGNYGVPLALLLLGGPTHRPWRLPVRLVGHGKADPFRHRHVFRVVQWTTVLLLTGHGALMLGANPTFVAHWAAIGVPAGAVPIIGGFEVLLAGAVAVRPGVGLLVFVAAWKMSTEGLWLVAGAPAWEWIERAGSYAAPTAAAILLGAYVRSRQPGVLPPPADRKEPPTRKGGGPTEAR